jgi:hypothetical protein
MCKAKVVVVAALANRRLGPGRFDDVGYLEWYEAGVHRERD